MKLITGSSVSLILRDLSPALQPDEVVKGEVDVGFTRRILTNNYLSDLSAKPIESLPTRTHQ